MTVNDNGTNNEENGRKKTLVGNSYAKLCIYKIYIIIVYSRCKQEIIKTSDERAHSTIAALYIIHKCVSIYTVSARLVYRTRRSSESNYIQGDDNVRVASYR